jgi:DUF1365 family protein
MNSCLYECEMMHARFSPQLHHFGYRIFMFALDLDELDALHHKLALFSFNRSNLYAFREGDYLPTNEPRFPAPSSPAEPTTALRSPVLPLKARVAAFLAAHGIDLTDGRVLLVTLPRVAGYVFNPVSFYFCYDHSGKAVAAIAEVTNTFKEMKPYFIPLQSTAEHPGEFHLRVPKHFYVSPFSDVDVEFDFILRAPGDALTVKIDDYTKGQRSFTSRLGGKRRPLTTARLAWFTLKYPLITLRIIASIHWHAFLLWIKKVPWFPKAGRPREQRELFRPHASLINQPKNA